MFVKAIYLFCALLLSCCCCRWISSVEAFLPVAWQAHDARRGSKVRQSDNNYFFASSLAFSKHESNNQSIKSFRKWEDYAPRLIPSIPTRETKEDIQKIKGYFHPRFVATEAVIGVQTMIKAYFTFWASTTFLKSCWSYLPIQPQLTYLPPIDWFQALDVSIYSFLSSLFPLLTRIPWLLHVVLSGPVQEEFFYRWFGLRLFYWAILVRCNLWAFMSKISPMGASILVVMKVYQLIIWQALPLLRLPSSALLHRMNVLVSIIVPNILGIFVQTLLIRDAYKKRRFERYHVDDKIAELKRTSTRDKEHTENAYQMGNIFKRITHILSHFKKRTPWNFLHIVSKDETITKRNERLKLILFLSYWVVSTKFAAAHAVSQELGDLSKMVAITSRQHYQLLLRYLQSFGFSLLIACPLLVHRSNLWAACGAHIAWNSISILTTTLQHALDSLGYSMYVSVPIQGISTYFVLKVLNHCIEVWKTHT